MIEGYLSKAGQNAVPKLSVAAGCAGRTIYRMRTEGYIPRPKTVYKLARACGWSHEAAIGLVQELLAIEVSETA